MVAKLFAKHIKLNEAMRTLQNTRSVPPSLVLRLLLTRARIGIGIGTPARVQDLLEAKALKTGNLKRIVLDGSYTDQKKRTIFDMKDLFQPLLQLLRRSEIARRYGNDENRLEIMVY